MRRIVVFGVLVAACSGGAAQTTTTAVASATTAAARASTTSTTEVATTSTTVPEVVDLGLGFLEPGLRYFHGFDLGGFDVIVEDAGWRVVVVGSAVVVFQNQSLGPTLEVTVTWKPFDTVDELIAELTSHPTVTDFTQPEPTSVGGFEGVMFDVTVPPPETPPAMVGQDSGCTSPVLAQEGAFGEVLKQSELLGCAVNRVWIAEVDGRSVVIHAGDESGEVRGGFTAPLDEVVPLIDQFLAAITFNP